MKKKKILKGWVERLLMIINLVMLLIIASDCANTIAFIISKIVALAILIINSNLLLKYGKEWS